MNKEITVSKSLMPPAFNSNAFGEVRVLQDNDNNLWFIANDVCSILGTNQKEIPSILDTDEHTTAYTLYGRYNNSGLRKDTRFVSESGLYSLILKSRKPEAQRFKKWVTSEVLPSIRKHGAYIKHDCISSDYLRKLADCIDRGGIE